MLVENTEILDTCKDSRRLNILEVLHIKEMEPRLNTQADNLLALPSMNRRTRGHSQQSARNSSQSATSSE
ncbi:hypothetical protein E2C01_096441 [Portunus trituberculatus]|uniref:Uncharacterized protein n=1 Tax=Portunus trituberculatus TaxID=210409 RepID=A0A5B7K886_PORTR|nr:hypothetical protein [Portunus trituberculatus]